MSEQSKVINFNKLGTVKVTVLNPEAPEVFAKLPSTSASMCPDGSMHGTGGANLNDDNGACPTGPAFTV